MSDQTGEIRDMTVRLIVTDNDRSPYIAELKAQGIDDIEVEMIKALGDQLIKRAMNVIKVERTQPIRKNQLTLLGGLASDE